MLQGSSSFGNTNVGRHDCAGFYPTGPGRSTVGLVSRSHSRPSKMTETSGMQPVLRVCLGTSQACSSFPLFPINS